MTVAITGSSGLVGSAPTAFLRTGGHRLIALVRHAVTGPDERQWRPDDPDPELLTGVGAVIHLAGASIAGRFTGGHRRAIRDSRIGPTRRLAELLSRGGPRPAVLVSRRRPSATTATTAAMRSSPRTANVAAGS